MATWRLAQSLVVLRAEINAAWPSRKKTSDGSIGDAAHASRKSDHNPWVRDGRLGVVTAVDIDDDEGRLDILAEHFRALACAGDRRIKYVISDGRIASATDSFAWRPYKGPNGHFKHSHLSVSPDLRISDSRETWHLARLLGGPAVAVVPAAAPAPVRAAGPVTPRFERELRATTLNCRPARAWQAQMRARGWDIKPDGDYGPKSAAACKAFQREKRLEADGVVGPITWAATWSLPVT